MPHWESHLRAMVRPPALLPQAILFLHSSFQRQITPLLLSGLGRDLVDAQLEAGKGGTSQEMLYKYVVCQLA